MRWSLAKLLPIMHVPSSVCGDYELKPSVTLFDLPPGLETELKHLEFPLTVMTDCFHLRMHCKL